MSQAPEDQPFVQLGPDHPTLYYPVSYKAQGGKGVIAIFIFYSNLLSFFAFSPSV